MDNHSLKKLSYRQLEELAQEIRQRIISVMGKNGGHLASNLGAVEFTIALHYVFESPLDKLIFDTSHQCYTHKILTGRNNRFETIRQHKGLCGFTHPDESPHDHFYAGHAGTAISLGLGMATARDLNERNEHVIPILGDADLTCGLTLEALNNIPQTLGKFITILNDNEMAIYESQGAMSEILSRVINNPTSNSAYQGIKKALQSIPAIGDLMTRGGRRLKESIKNLVSPALFFEQFELSYVGPIDGHNIPQMIETFEQLKNTKKATLVHLRTVKGKGLDAAEEKPITYHGVKPTNAKKSSKPSFPKVFGKQIVEMAERDKQIYVISPATPVGASLLDMIEKFPDRCKDVGIAEGHAVTFAGGLAKEKNCKPVVSIYSTFMMRAFDNIFHDVCLQRLPVLFAIDRASLSAADGCTHHGIYDLSFLRAMPNMVIAVPRSGELLRELMESAFSWNRPVAIRYPNLTTEFGQVKQKRKLGKGEVLQGGKEIALIALGHMCDVMFEVAEILREQGYEPTIIDPIFVKPLDEELLYSIALTHKRLVTIEEHAVNSGLGAEVANWMVREEIQNVKLQMIGIPDRYVEHGDRKNLLEEIELTAEQIAKRVIAYDDSLIPQ